MRSDDSVSSMIDKIYDFIEREVELLRCTSYALLRDVNWSFFFFF